MNKKGFTLVELLAVIVLIAVISSIGITSYIVVKNKINKKIFTNKLAEIVSSSEKWGEYNKEKLTNKDENNLSYAVVKLSELIKSDYFETDESFDATKYSCTNKENGLCKDVVVNNVDNLVINDLQIKVFKKNKQVYGCIIVNEDNRVLLNEEYADDSKKAFKKYNDLNLYCSDTNTSYVAPVEPTPEPKPDPTPTPTPEPEPTPEEKRTMYAYQKVIINNGGQTYKSDDVLQSGYKVNVDEAYNASINYIQGKPAPNFKKGSFTNEGMLATEDNIDISYYFRGAVDNNWVQFGKDSSGKNIYWRIIRLNGDNSIRMIYSGTTVPTSSTNIVMVGQGTQINGMKYQFNNIANSPVYAGYMYAKNNLNGYSESSVIKKELEKWIKTTTLETDSKTKNIIVDQIFCVDRTSAIDSDGPYKELTGRIDLSKQYFYGAFERIISKKIPSLRCSLSSDKFTATSNYGNGALSYSVGLLTADELVFAGAANLVNNSNFYLYTNQGYWLITPFRYSENKAFVFSLTNKGEILSTSLGSHYGIRPVININGNIEFTGNGTWNDPYKVKTN